jgi:hypothetical protein
LATAAPQWDGEITGKKFSCLHKNQKEDLIEYFFEQNSAKTSAKSKPAYRFPLNQLRDYFGKDVELSLEYVKKTVENSQDYKDFVAERQRSQAPPPPPEMSLLTAARKTQTQNTKHKHFVTYVGPGSELLVTSK